MSTTDEREAYRGELADADPVSAGVGQGSPVDTVQGRTATAPDDESGGRDFLSEWRARKAETPQPATGPAVPRGNRPNYGAAILAGEVARVLKAVKGTRNDTLNVAALKVGRAVAGGYVDENEARAALYAAARTVGLVADDGPKLVTGTISSGIRAGKRTPRDAGPATSTAPAAPEPTEVTGDPAAPGDGPGVDEDRHRSGPALRAGMRARLLSRGALAELPEPEPLIDGTIDRRTVAVVAGHFGSLKSFVLQDWAACIATGRPWMGRPVRQGSALYVAAEGAHGLHARFAAWEYGWRRTIPDDALAVLPDPVNLTDPAAVAELCELVAGRDLVVVDTLARCIVGADENSARDMGIAVDALHRLRDATGDGTVVVAHHTGKDRTTVRGSSALEAGVDTVYQTEGDAGLMRMTRTKRKDGPAADALSLMLSVVLNSAVVVSAAGVDMNANARALMSVFVSAFGTTGGTKSDLRAVAEMPPASFHRALNELVRGGLLVNDGTEHRPFYRAQTAD